MWAEVSVEVDSEGDSDTMRYRETFVKTARSFGEFIPLLIGVLLLVSLLISAMRMKLFELNIFTGNVFIDSFIGAVFGSFATGNPITSYIIGGEFLRNGIPLVVVTSFLVAWVTVGMVQLPAESIMLGRRFAITRNLVSFLLSIAVAVAVVLTLGLV